MALYAKFENAGFFKQIVDSINGLVKQCSIKCNENGVFLEAMDASLVSIISLNINKDKFLEYNCEEEILLGVSMVNLSKILKGADNKDFLILKNDNNSKLNIEYGTEGKLSKISKFEMNLLNIENENGFEMDTNYDINIKIDSSEFKKIIHNLAEFGNECIINVDKSGSGTNFIDFSVTGELGKGNITIEENNEENSIISIKNNVQCNMKFSIEYLEKFTKATTLSKHVNIEISNNTPILIKYNLENDSNNGSVLKYYLVPKID